MKPSTLKPGQRVLIKSYFGGGSPNHGTFIRCVPRSSLNPGRPTYSIIRVDEYAGLASAPNGECSYTDYDISRLVEPLEASAL